jgi:hypothetical protein
VARSYEAQKRARLISIVLLPVVWIGGLWVLSEVVGKGLFGLDGLWAWLVGAACAVVAVPAVAFGVYLAIPFVYKWVTGKRVDWR